MRKIYNTEVEKKAANRLYNDKYISKPSGRANNLLTSYRREDKKYNRGECTLTAEWIVEHIFTQPCAHCGESDWRKIGCNRLDNSLPHTPDNVEPCCKHCNDLFAAKEKKKTLSKTVYQYTLDGKLIKVWESTAECGRNGFDRTGIGKCCNGKLKTHKGCIWSFIPL